MIKFLLLKEKSHQIRLVKKWYDWKGLDEYGTLGTYTYLVPTRAGHSKGIFVVILFRICLS